MVDVEIYMNNIIKFFRENPTDLLNLVPKDKEEYFYTKIKEVAIENYKKGVLHGKRTVFYVPENLRDTTNRVSQMSNYKDGVRDGGFIEYFDNGVLKHSSNYEKGKCVGDALSYHPNGKLMIKDTFLNGAKEGWCYAFNEEGVESGKSYFHSGKRLSEEELQKFLKKKTQKK